VGVLWTFSTVVELLRLPDMKIAIPITRTTTPTTSRIHPAVLMFALGNEIPASIVRWHGSPRVEQFIERLYHTAKEQDPSKLVTYVNYPTTEYLHLPFLDLFCFNVYLEAQTQLEAYLARLQSLAGEKPLLLTELGLDSRRNGMGNQAHTLSWQLPTAFAAGCAGAAGSALGGGKSGAACSCACAPKGRASSSASSASSANSGRNRRAISDIAARSPAG
jgi:hypothetical protein